MFADKSCWLEKEIEKESVAENAAVVLKKVDLNKVEKVEPKKKNRNASLYFWLILAVSAPILSFWLDFELGFPSLSDEMLRVFGGLAYVFGISFTIYGAYEMIMVILTKYHGDIKNKKALIVLGILFLGYHHGMRFCENLQLSAGFEEILKQIQSRS